MAEYCLQCFNEIFPPNTPDTFTARRKTSIVCEGCGETVVDFKGRCTGACGKDHHGSKFMAYIFETRPPGFQFANIHNKSFKGRFFKVSVDLMQWIPRITFVLSLFYMFGMAIFLRLLEIGKAPEELELDAELAAARSSYFYDKSLKFWYRAEMKLENILFG